MWYLIVSAIAFLAILSEKTNNSKLGYLAISLFFPTIAYSLWRVNSEKAIDSQFTAVLRLGIWFSISHTILSIVWLINTYYNNMDTTNAQIIILLWIIAVSFSITLGTFSSVKTSKKVTNRLNQSAI